MRTVDIGIRHDDDFVIAGFGDIERHIGVEVLILACIVVTGEACSDRADHRLKLVLPKPGIPALSQRSASCPRAAGSPGNGGRGLFTDPPAESPRR